MNRIGGPSKRLRGVVIRIALLYPSDPLGFSASGIDSFVRGVLKFAPTDVQYTLFGTTSMESKLPLMQAATVMLQGRDIRYVPIVRVEQSGVRRRVPLILRYTLALLRASLGGALREFQGLDFHRMEPLLVLRGDSRPKSLFMHQDYSGVVDARSEIGWRHIPWAYRALERFVFPSVSFFYSVREPSVAAYRQAYPQLAERFEFMPTWVDVSAFRPIASESERELEKFAQLRELAADTGGALLVYVGRLDHAKDPLLLLAALRLLLARHSRWHLAMVGDGILRGEVEAALRVGPLQGKVSLLGARPATDIQRLLRTGDLFVLPSAYEGMPFAVLEALACGIPVVCTDVGEVKRVVNNDSNGYICVQRTAAAFSDCLDRGLVNAGRLRGTACVSAVKPYVAETVLERVFERYRARFPAQTLR